MDDAQRIELVPEAPADVREAVAAAVRDAREPHAEPSPWWRAGLEESVRDELSRG